MSIHHKKSIEACWMPLTSVDFTFNPSIPQTSHHVADLIKHFKDSTKKNCEIAGKWNYKFASTFFSSTWFWSFLLFGFCQSKKKAKRYEITFIEFLGLGEKKRIQLVFSIFSLTFQRSKRKKAGWKSRKLMREPNLKVNVYDFIV